MISSLGVATVPVRPLRMLVINHSTDAGLHQRFECRNGWSVVVTPGHLAARQGLFAHLA